MIACGEDRRVRVGEFVSNLTDGFFLDRTLEDMAHLENKGSHLIDNVEEYYQDVLDLCIKNHYSQFLLGCLSDIRDEKNVPKLILAYVRGKLSDLNRDYLSKTTQTLEEGLFRS